MRFHIRQFLLLIVIKIQLAVNIIADFYHLTARIPIQKAQSLNLLVACLHLLGPRKK